MKEFTNYIQQQAIEVLSNKIQLSLDDIVKEGLKRKGIVFETNWHYGQFIEANCTKTVDACGVETYYVADDPFLEYHKPQEYINPPSFTDDPNESYKITATLGQYRYL